MCSISKRKSIMLMRKVRLAVKFKNFAFCNPHLGYLTLKTVALIITNRQLQMPLLTLIQTCDACSVSSSLCTTSTKARLHRFERQTHRRSRHHTRRTGNDDNCNEATATTPVKVDINSAKTCRQRMVRRLYRLTLLRYTL